MIGTYYIWWLSYILVCFAGTGHGGIGAWPTILWALPLCVTAAVATAVWDGAEARIERQWRQHYREQAIARRLEEITRARGVVARILCEVPPDEQWAREVMRLLKIDDERTN